MVCPIFFLEFDNILEECTQFHMDNSGCKKRTARNYALKDVAVKYLMKENPEVFERLGRKWDGDEKSYMHVRI